MSFEMFIIMLVAFSAVSALLTEAIKTFAQNMNKVISPNVTALVDAVIVGGIGSAAVFNWMSIPFITPNILALVAMIFCVWMGSMTSYDKVIQTVKQIKIV